MALRCNRVRCAATTGCAAVCGRRCTAAIGRFAALQPLQPVAADCGLLQRGCNGLLPVATDGAALQQGALRCNNRLCCRLWHTLNCDHWRLRRAAIAATGRSGLRTVAKGCALMQQMALRCNKVRCAATTGCAAVCGRRCTAAIGRFAALRSLQQVAADCGLLQRAVPCCNRWRCVATGCAALQQQVVLPFAAHAAV